MGKRLEDRSLEELWQLFPIFLVPYKKEWAGWYREEKGRLEVLLGAGRVKRVSQSEVRLFPVSGPKIS